MADADSGSDYAAAFTLYRGADADRTRQWIQRMSDALGDAPRETVVDIGCGPGRFSSGLRAAFSHYVGIDLSEAMLNHATEHGVEALVRGNSCALPLRTGCASACLASMVLPHVTRPDRLLAEARRVLAPGGVLVVRQSLQSDLWRTTWYSVVPEARRHDLKRVPSRRWIQSVLTRSGFSVERYESHIDEVDAEHAGDLASRIRDGAYDALHRIDPAARRRGHVRASGRPAGTEEKIASTLIVARPEGNP